MSLKALIYGVLGECDTRTIDRTLDCKTIVRTPLNRAHENAQSAQSTIDPEAFEERTAIMEHEGGLSREQAVVEKCNQCRHFNKFGNCLMPQEAGLTTRFELIRAPGEACQVFELKPAPY
jgi:hypothetical protein